MRNFHYVYRIDLPETGEFYFGSRGCDYEPLQDTKYMGSMSTWKPDKIKLVKTIIKSNFIDRKDAGKIPWNKGKITSKETKIKQSLARRGKIPWNKGTKGLYKISEETKKKMSDSHKIFQMNIKNSS